MFPIILNGVDEDDEALLLEANSTGDHSGYNEVSPLFQDNLRCSIGRRLARRFSFDQSNRSSVNQLIQPGERIIEIKTDSEDEDDNVPSSSTAAVIREQTNPLNNDFRFQRFRPIRIAEHDLTASDHHSQARMQRNYQVLKSKKRFTFPIFFFFVGLYVAFLVLSSIIFTKFEQKLPDTDHFFELQKKLMLTLTPEQYDLIQNLVEASIQIQKSGVDSIGVLNDNRMLINQMMIRKGGSGNKATMNVPNSESFNSSLESVNLMSTSFEHSTKSDERFPIITNQVRNRKVYNWDFQQALFYVVSIATTIGYGNLTPESVGGKIYTIIFGMISIPYTTILFSIIVSKFSNGPLRRFKLSLLTKHFQEKSHETLRIIRFICLIMATFFILVMVIAVPGWLFTKMEKHWTYIDSIYFIFISITTTGLGDYVPEFVGAFHYWIYELMVIIFLYFGIIMIMLWLTLIKSVFRRSTSIKLDEYDRDEEDRHEAVLEEQVLINYHYRQKNYVNYGSFYGYDEVSVQVPQ